MVKIRYMKKSIAHIFNGQAHRHQQYRKKLTGFTMIEVMVVLGILAILAGMAAPAWTSTIERYKVKTIREDFVSSLYLARTEAMRRGGGVTLAKKTGDAANCPGFSINGRWECGWNINQGNESIQQREASKNVELTVTGANLNTLTFDRWGQSSGCFSFLIQSKSTTTAKQHFHLTGAGVLAEGACS